MLHCLTHLIGVCAGGGVGVVPRCRVAAGGGGVVGGEGGGRRARPGVGGGGGGGAPPSPAPRPAPRPPGVTRLAPGGTVGVLGGLDQ